MRGRNNSLARRVAAVVCFAAVLLMQAPFASAAWLASSMACCMGDHCPIPSHHHKAAPKESQMPMDCGHHSSKLSECKMSCCKSTDETAVNTQFVIPAPHSMEVIESAAPADIHSAPQLLPRAEKPQSPPPRTILA